MTYILEGYALPVATFGENVQRIMKDRGITQVKLADRLGLRQPSAWKWEHATGLPQTATLFKLAKALECTVPDLLLGLDVEYDQLLVKLEPASKRMEAEPEMIIKDLERKLAEAEQRRQRYESAMGDVKTVVQQLLAMADLASQERVDVAVDAVMSEAKVREDRKRASDLKRKRKKSKHAKANVRRMRS